MEFGITSINYDLDLTVTSSDDDDEDDDDDDEETTMRYLTIKEVYAATGQRISEGDALMSFTEDSITSVRKLLENALVDAKADYSDAEDEYPTLMAILRLDSAGLLKLKVDAWPLPTEENFAKVTAPLTQGRVKIDTYKLYRDGALGSRGSLLKEDYSDMPGQKGMEFYPIETFEKYCRWCYDHGFRVATHCIGDQANASALDVYGKILGGKNDLGWRIEHAQIVSDEDIDKFSKYSVIPSFQPTHCTSDMFWAKERLGSRIKDGYRYKELLDQLGWAPSGTDFPIESVNPVYTFFAAVFRKNLEFKPEGGFQMENALSREEALKTMTIWAAKSTKEESRKGSIEAGKAADFVFTDIDFFKADEKEVPKTKVLGTWINGEQVYSFE